MERLSAKESWSEYELQKAFQLKDKGFSYAEIAKEFVKDPKCQNRSRDAIRIKTARWLRQAPKTPKDEVILSVLKKHRNISIYELADILDVSPKKVREQIEWLIEKGKKITVEDERVEFLPPEQGKTIRIEEGDEGHIIFGLISDTHIGSKYQQISALRDFYELCARRGVRKVFHSGDWVAGKRIYRGQEYDLFLHSMKDQRKYLIENYPYIDGIETIGIRGNHDEAWTLLVGDPVMELVAERRPDITIIGEYQGFVEWAGFRFSLHHPGGGQAYAISYKLQKLVESFTAENLPDFVSMGHFHQKEYVTIRNVECFQPGCFEAQTPYEIRKNLHPVIGGWIVEAQKTKNGIDIIAEFKRYKPLERDW